MRQILEGSYLGLLVNGPGPADQFQTGVKIGDIGLQGGHAKPLPRTFHTIAPVIRLTVSTLRPGTGPASILCLWISWAGIFNHSIDDMQYLSQHRPFLNFELIYSYRECCKATKRQPKKI